MTKSELIDAISELTTVSKNDVKAVIESMATVLPQRKADLFSMIE